jgi:hypothetical protein
MATECAAEVLCCNEKVLKKVRMCFDTFSYMWESVELVDPLNFDHNATSSSVKKLCQELKFKCKNWVFGFWVFQKPEFKK